MRHEKFGGYHLALMDVTGVLELMKAIKVDGKTDESLNFLSRSVSKSVNIDTNSNSKKLQRITLNNPKITFLTAES